MKRKTLILKELILKKLRKFKCKTGEVIERFAHDDQNEVKCKCGEVAAKTISAARYFSNTVGKSPSA